MDLKDKVLLKISIITAVIGLFSLFLIMFFYQPESIMIKDSNNHQGEKVAINGFVKSIYVYNKSSIVIIEQSSSIQGLMFDKIDMNLVNRSVTVYGKIQDEKIIIDKIIQK